MNDNDQMPHDDQEEELSTSEQPIAKKPPLSSGDKGRFRIGDTTKTAAPPLTKPKRTRFNSAAELILEDLPRRIGMANKNLLSHMKGKVLIQMKNAGGFLIDWSKAPPTVEETKDSSADTEIVLSEADLLKIADGTLNPQISMLSQKVFIKGDTDVAVYFLNFIAPY